MTNWKIEKRSLQELKGYDKNPRKFTKKGLKDLKASLKKCGDANIITINADNTVLGGHARLTVMKELGYETVDVKVPDRLLNEKEVQEIVIRLNANTAGEWDIDKLVADFEVSDLEEWGLDIDLPTEEDEVDEIEVPVEVISRCKFGDIWQLGEHRLMCGSSTEVESVKALMNNEKADMVFTDPPYGVKATGGRSQTKEKLGMKAIKNDDLVGDKLTKFLSDFIAAMQFKEGASIYVCYAWATQKEFTEALKENDLSIKNCIIWDKKNFGLNGHKGYRPQYEMIYFCCKDDFVWYGDKSQGNIWQIAREIKRKQQGNHPTPKPIELIARALKNSSKKEDIVYDAFGGSGSTIIACEQLQRKCYTMELEPGYCDVIIQRWENLTGQKAVLLGNMV